MRVIFFSFFVIILTFFILDTHALQAQSLNNLRAVPHEDMNISDSTTSEALRKGKFRLESSFACYGRNNRGVSDPVQSSATVIFKTIFINPEDKSEMPLELEFPASVLSSQGWSIGSAGNVNIVTPKTGVKASIHGNSLLVEFEDFSPIVLTAQGDIENIDIESLTKKGSVLYEQRVIGGQVKSISDIRLDKWELSGDMQTLKIVAAFPGEDGFCGGYRSPLMLFFSDARPKFNHFSGFPMYPNSNVYWPEKNAPGYFLALDENNNGKIDSRKELFSNHTFQNGFEALKIHDKNKDNLIDRKDPSFQSLKLWTDKNGDGISQKDEVQSLASHNVKFISLNYNDDQSISYNHGAEARQSSMFSFLKDGIAKEGHIIDIWLQAHSGR